MNNKIEEYSMEHDIKILTEEIKFLKNKNMSMKQRLANMEMELEEENYYEEEEYDDADIRDACIYRCEICDAAFSVKKYFISHIKNHKEYREACKDCGETFDNHDDFSNHIELHRAHQAAVAFLSVQIIAEPGHSCSAFGLQLASSDDKFKCVIYRCI